MRYKYIIEWNEIVQYEKWVRIVDNEMNDDEIVCGIVNIIMINDEI